MCRAFPRSFRLRVELRAPLGCGIEAGSSSIPNLARPAFVDAQVTCAPAAQVVNAVPVSREQSKPSLTGEWSQIVECPAGMRAFAGGGYFRHRDGRVGDDNHFMGATRS